MLTITVPSGFLYPLHPFCAASPGGTEAVVNFEFGGNG